jgi:hypothetical protein
MQRGASPVKRAALLSSRRPLCIRPARSDNYAAPFDEIKDNTPGESPAPGKVRKRGRAPPQASDFSVSSDLPEIIPISENELRALETLLGLELKDLLAK